MSGAFVVIDRASRPIKRIRREAQETERSLKRLGAQLDRVGNREQRQQMDRTVGQMRKLSKESGTAAAAAGTLRQRLDKVGAPQVARNIDTTARAIKNTDTAAQDADHSVTRMSTGVRKLGRESDGAGGKLRRFGASMIGLRQLLIVGLIPAIGLAAQGLGSLGAGAVALIPKLTDLVGVAGALPSTFLGLGLAMGTVKLATAHLSKALGGNKNALKALTPEAKAFLVTMKQWQPIVKDLRRDAQRGLFPGLEDSLQRLQRLAPTLGTLLGNMGGALGQLAREGSRRFTTRGFMDDLHLLGNQGVRLVTRAGRTLLNLADAARHVAVAAAPFTEWLSKTVEGLSEGVLESAKLGRENGRMSRFFDRTRDSLQRFGSILSNVWGALRGIGRAARPMGDALWQSIDRVTKRWDDWSNSATGQRDMRVYFAEMKAPLSALVGLIGDLGRGIGQLSRGTGFTQSINALRGAMPDLVRGLDKLSGTFGPTMVNALSSVLQLFGNLGQNSSPLVRVLRLFANIADGLNTLIDRVPLLGTLLTTALATGAVYRMMTAVQRLAGSWFGVARGARTAAAAEAEATAMGAAGGVAGGAAAGGAAAAAAAARGSQGRLSGLLTGAATTAAAARAVGVRGTLRTAAGALGRSRLGGAVAGAGRFMAPLAIGSGVLSAASYGTGGRGFGGLLANFGSGVSLGALDPVVKPDWGTLKGIGTGAAQELAAGLGTAGTAGYNAKLRTLIGQVNREATVKGVSGPLEKHAADALEQAGFKGLGAKGVKAGLGVLRGQLRLSVRLEHEQAVRQARDTADRLAMQFGQAFDVYNRTKGHGIGWAMDQTTGDVLKRMRRMGPVGSRRLAENMLEWGREQARQNPKLWSKYGDLARGIEKTFRRMGRDIQVVNGTILDGSRKTWSDISTALIDPAERAREKVSKAFTDMQQIAAAQLTMMGFSRADANSIVRGLEAGGARGRAAGTAARTSGANSRALNMAGGAPAQAARGATGMRIRGVGLRDTVQVAPGHLAAPGELIVNRHTERRIDRVLRAYGTSLGREVAGESRPHYAAYGDRVGGGGTTRALTGVTAGLGRLIQRLDSKGFRHGSTTQGRHAANSYHYRGMAVDYGDASNDMQRLWSTVYPSRRRFAELFGPTRVTPGPHLMHNGVGFNDAGLQAQHQNHIHIALTGNGGVALRGAGGALIGGGGVGHVRLRPGSTGIPGAAGVMGDRARAVIARGMQRRINQQLDETGGGTVNMAGGSRQLNRWLTMALRLTGHFSPGNLAALRGRAMQESGGNPLAVNNWDSNAAAGTPSIGLLQTIQPTFNRYKMRGMGNIRNPVHNAVAAIRYMMATYGHIVGPSGTGYATGGRVPEFGGWFARGGRRRFNRPTLIGVGEAGPEDVQVSPVRAGGGGARAQVMLNFAPGSIVIGGADEQGAQQFVDMVMDRLAAAIDAMGLEPEGALS